MALCAHKVVAICCRYSCRASRRFIPTCGFIRGRERVLRPSGGENDRTGQVGDRGIGSATPIRAIPPRFSVAREFLADTFPGLGDLVVRLILISLQAV